MPRLLLVGIVLLALSACSHAPPRLIQVVSQVNRVFDPEAKAWSSWLSVFVQASSADGNKVFDRMHLLHDGQALWVPLTHDTWTPVERTGEFWVGSNGLNFGDAVPTGTWRVQLVTRSGQKVETSFEVPTVPVGTPAPRTASVTVRRDPNQPGRWSVSGWVDDYLVWSRDAKGVILARTKTVGPSFQVLPAAASVSLYSYDKNRGEGLLAGPFPVQDLPASADR